MAQDTEINQLPSDLPVKSDVFPFSKGDLVTNKTTFQDAANLVYQIFVDDQRSFGNNGEDSYIAGENISSLRLCVVVDNHLFHFDPENLDHYNRVVGVSKQAGLTNLPVLVVKSGKMAGFAGSLTQDGRYYGGATGQLTETPPTADCILQFVGEAIDVNTLLIKLGEAVELQ